MFSLTARAEEAFLGALLCGAPNPETLNLSADDFATPERAGLYRTIITVPDDPRPPAEGGLIDAVAEAMPTVSRDELVRYRGACPNREHILDYGRIVSTAALRRDVIRQAGIIGVAFRHSPDGPGTEQQRRRMHGLYRLAHRHDLATDAQLPRHYAFTMEPLPARPGPLIVSADPRVRREEQLLAGLLHDPDVVRRIAPILPSDSFTSSRRAEIYQTIVARAAAGEAVDEVLVAWHMEQRRDPAAFDITDLPGRIDQHDADFAYLRGLADSPVPRDGVRRLAGELARADIPAARPTLSLAAGTDRVHPDPPPATTASTPQTALDPTLRPPAPSTPHPGPRLRP